MVSSPPPPPRQSGSTRSGRACTLGTCRGTASASRAGPPPCDGTSPRPSSPTALRRTAPRGSVARASWARGACSAEAAPGGASPSRAPSSCRAWSLVEPRHVRELRLGILVVHLGQPHHLVHEAVLDEVTDAVVRRERSA